MYNSRREWQRGLAMICWVGMTVLTSLAQVSSTDTDKLLSIDQLFQSTTFYPQYLGPTQWMGEGKSFTLLARTSSEKVTGVDILRFSETTRGEVLVSAEALAPKGSKTGLYPETYAWSSDEQQLLVFTNSQRVWRDNTRGDYWIVDLEKDKLSQLGQDLPEASLMFAKFSPDETKVAYVSNNNLYVEDVNSDTYLQLTQDGTRDIINGTFDWVYEEELSCQDGFRWSPDGTHIAYWQLDASDIGNFNLINYTDSVYSKVIPIQYPKVGQDPSSCRVGVISADGGETIWMDIPGDPKQHYIPRMQWLTSDQLLVQQLNRKQNQLIFWICNPRTGTAEEVYRETDEAWIDLEPNDVIRTRGMVDLPVVDEGSAVLRLTEKDGWRHVYKISLETGAEELLTPGDYDIAKLYHVEDMNDFLYVNASPTNSTQRYLYRISLKGSREPERLTPESYSGINHYDISPDGGLALHTHSNAITPETTHLIELPGHTLIQTLINNDLLKEQIAKLDLPEVEFFSITTEDGVELDGRMIKPLNFDESKKYPVLFNVYGEPASQTAVDSWGGIGWLWHMMLAQKGYCVITMDNRGTPCLKGREWRKSIYRKVGIINSRDQAMAAQKVLTWPYIDPDRVAVWGWSGGGSMTLNLLFRYPEIYQTGMSVAPVSNQLYYDNIYQERYMGLPQENLDDFIEGSPITYAKYLEGNLLLVHGTGDDNVHYQNTAALINELIRYNKQFQVMPYPNRTHGIYEGANTRRHLYTLLTGYLESHTAPGPGASDSSYRR